jgi:hypothetical protein
LVCEQENTLQSITEDYQDYNGYCITLAIIPRSFMHTLKIKSYLFKEVCSKNYFDFYGFKQRMHWH